MLDLQGNEAGFQTLLQEYPLFSLGPVNVII